MGVRSDVGIAITNEVFDQLSVRTKLFLKEDFHEEEHMEDPPGFAAGTEGPGGRLFHCSNIKWYRGGDEEIDRLYKELDKIDEDGERYLIIEGCYDYPENTDSDAGNWWDNPWDMYKSVSVSVEYCAR
mgnify:FL=1